MALKHDSQGFLIGTPVELNEVMPLWTNIRDDVRAIRAALAGQAPYRVANPSVAAANQAKLAGARSGGGNRYGSGVQGIAMPMARDAHGRLVARDSSSRQEGGVAAARSIKAFGEAAKRAAVVPGPAAERDARGRFASSGDGGGVSDRSVNALAGKLSRAVLNAGSGIEEADPAVKAMQEVAQPMARGYELLTGGGEDKKQTGLLRRIFAKINVFHKDETALEKANAKTLKSIEGKPGATGGDGGGGILAWISQRFSGLFSGLLPMLGTVFTRILGPIAGVIAAWNVGQWIGTKIYDWMNESGINEKIFETVDWVRDKAGAAWDSVISGWDTCVGYFKDTWAGVAKTFDAAIDWIKGKWGLGKEKVKEVYDKAKETPVVGAAIKQAEKGVQYASEKAGAAVQAAKAAGAWVLGKTSRWFESGKGGAGTVSSGKGDFGGASYGTYQLSSKQGEVQKFLKQSGYGAQFSGMEPGSAEFNARWKEVAKNDPSFEAAQHDYIKSTKFDAQMAKLKNGGIDLTGRGSAVQDAVWSTSVQFGGKTGLIQKALAGKNAAEMSDAEIVAAIQDYKIANNDRLFKSSSASVRAGTASRAINEKAQLLSLATPAAPAVVSAKTPSAPSAPAVPVINEAPPTIDPMASTGGRTVAITAPAPEVGQNVSDARIAHIASGGIA